MRPRSPWKHSVHKANFPLKEYAMVGNPHRRHHYRMNRRRHHVKGHWSHRGGHRFHVRGHTSNPGPYAFMNARRHRRPDSYYYHNARRHHRHHHYGYSHNPGVGTLVKHPGEYLMKGLWGTLGAWFAISLPNRFLPFAGTDIMSKVLRLGTRAAAGGLVYWGAKKIMPRQAGAVAVGATIGVAGSFVLDMLGTTLVIGAGDTIVQPFALLSGVGLGGYAPGVIRTAFAGYSRPALAAAAGMSGRFGRGTVGFVDHGRFGNS